MTIRFLGVVACVAATLLPFTPSSSRANVLAYETSFSSFGIEDNSPFSEASADKAMPGLVILEATFMQA